MPYLISGNIDNYLEARRKRNEEIKKDYEKLKMLERALETKREWMKE